MIQHSPQGAQALKGAILALALLLAGCAGPGGPSATATAPTAAVSAPTVASATAVPAPTSAPPAASATAVPAPAPTAASATAAPAGDADAAVQAVIDYYQAINQQQYDAAYMLWANNGAASGQTLDQFKQKILAPAEAFDAIGG